MESGSDRPTDEKKEPFNYDDILRHLGQFGKFQLRSFLWLCLPAMFHGTTVMSIIFTGGVPLYRCKVPVCDDIANSEEFEPSWLNNTIPWNDEDKQMKQCYRFNDTWADLGECTNGSIEHNDQKVLCDDWVFDDSIFDSTVVTEFDVTCDREWQATLANSLFMFGMLVGALTVGQLGDIFGRKITFTCSVILLGAMMTGSAFAPDMITFCILRFFCGIGSCGLFLTLFVWGVEAVGKKYRVICGCIYQIMYAMGAIILGVLGYFIRDWRTLQLIIALPIFIFTTYYWIVPESTRWLITKKRYDEARQLILKAEDINMKTVPSYMLVTPTITADQSIGSNKSSSKSSIMVVLRSSVLLKRILILFGAWIAGSMCYYGITYSASNLSGDFYLNYELSIIVELPAYIGAIMIMDKLGRRPALSGSLLISGLACLTTGLVPDDIPGLRTAFSLIGKLFISCAVATSYSFTSELFPTSTRSAAVGLCSMIGRIGGILAPIIADSGRRVSPALPYIIFAGVNIVVGVLCLFLPETNGIHLPATVDEALDMEKYNLCCLRKQGNNTSSKETTPVSPAQLMNANFPRLSITSVLRQAGVEKYDPVLD